MCLIRVAMATTSTTTTTTTTTKIYTFEYTRVKMTNVPRVETMLLRMLLLLLFVVVVVIQFLRPFVVTCSPNVPDRRYRGPQTYRRNAKFPMRGMTTCGMGGRAKQIAYVQAFRSFIAEILMRGEGWVRKVHSFTLLPPVPLLLLVALATASGVGGCC